MHRSEIEINMKTKDEINYTNMNMVKRMKMNRVTKIAMWPTCDPTFTQCRFKMNFEGPHEHQSKSQLKAGSEERKAKGNN